MDRGAGRIHPENKPYGTLRKLADQGRAGPADWRIFSTYSRNYGAPGGTGSDGRRYPGVTGRQGQWSFMLELGGREVLGELAQRKNAGVMAGFHWVGR